MRRIVVSSAVLVSGLLSLTPATAGEVTRTLRAELSRAEAAGRFAVENLAGTMRIVRGRGQGVVATATFHAGSSDLLDALRFERVESQGEGKAPSGVPVLRVRYPLDRAGTIRYPRAADRGDTFVSRLFEGCHTRVKYDGHQVTVSSRSGTLLYADVEVQVPPGEIDATFRNVIGLLRGRDLSGTITFDSDGGDQEIEAVRGTVIADTGSGDVRASGVEGSLRCDTGSGHCRIEDFRGEELVCDTGSGDVAVRSARARRFRGDTGSGDVTLQAASAARLRRVTADTGSGDVTLDLGPEASFEALADQGSGDIDNRYADARPILKKKELVGYRRGDGKIRIEVDTGSGDLTLEPGPGSARINGGRAPSGETGSTPSR